MGHTHVEDKPNVASSSAMWFGLLLIVLVISAVNFIKVSSGGHGHEVAHHENHHDAAHTDAHEAHPAPAADVHVIDSAAAAH